MNTNVTDAGLTIFLEGHIDSKNAGDVEAELVSLRAASPQGKLTLDASNLDYIASAGLRTIMKVARTEPDFSIVEAAPAVYDVFEMTGFTQMLDVRKKMRRISVEGCECIGRGGNGAVYRIDDETIVKVYYSFARTLEDIQRSRSVAQKLLALGIPVAIAFDVVRVGDNGDLGLIFELLNCKTVGQMVHEDPSKTHYWAQKAADLFKLLHTTEAPEGSFPDARDISHGWVETVGDWTTPEEKAAMHKLYSSLPYKSTLVHGDFHTGNMMVLDGEILIIDTDDVSQGDPILDLASNWLTFENINTEDRALFSLNMSLEEAKAFWHEFLVCYYGTDDEETMQKLELQRKLYGLPKLLWGIARTPTIPDDVKKQVIPQVKAGTMQMLTAMGIA